MIVGKKIKKMSSYSNHTGAAPTRVGLDTVRLTVPVADTDRLTTLPQARDERGTFDGRWHPAGFFIGKVRRDKVMVEASLPRLATGSNRNPLPLSDAPRVIYEEMLDKLAEVLTFDDASPVRVSRLDTVTDLDCARWNVDPVLRAFEQAPAANRTIRKALHRSGSSGFETLVIENQTTARVQMYSQEDKDGDPYIGLMRVEAQNKRRRLDEFDLMDINQLLDGLDLVPEVHKKSVEWAGLTREIVNIEAWEQRAYETCQLSGWSDRKTDQFLAWKVRQAHRLPEARYLKANALRDFRVMDTSLGIHPSPSSTEYRLDFDNGRVVTNMATINNPGRLRRGSTYRDARGHRRVRLGASHPEIEALLASHS